MPVGEVGGCPPPAGVGICQRDRLVGCALVGLGAGEVGAKQGQHPGEGTGGVPGTAAREVGAQGEGRSVHGVGCPWTWVSGGGCLQGRVPMVLGFWG